MTLKKLICLALVTALALTALTGCRGKPQEAAPEATAGANNPEGPGYTITDGTTTNSVPDAPVELTPQQRAAMSVGQSEGEQVVPVDIPLEDEEELLPPGGDLAAEEEAMAEAAASAEGDVVLGTYDENADTAPHAAPSAIDTNAYQYTQVDDENIDFTFNVPSHWELVPGIYTVCYREKVDDGDFPARLAITRKKLVHTPDDIVMNDQMTSYLKAVSKQYDPETFQIGTEQKDIPFIRRKGIANTYLAYWGSVEVKGYVLGVAVDRTLYVFHFCASYSDYAELESVMQYMASTVTLYEDPKDKKKKR